MESGWKVVLADELVITRRAVTAAIRTDSEHHQVVECETAEAALSHLEQMEATLLLVDLQAPGLSLVEAARQRHLGLKIVVLAGYDQPADVLNALKAGADGFLVKGMFPQELVKCLRSVVDTGVVVAPRVLKKALSGVAERPAPPALTNRPSAIPLDDQVVNLLTLREREIFELVALNRSNKEIAATLHIAEQTVKVHVSRILSKLGQPNRAQAVIHVLRSSRHQSHPVPLRGVGRP